jgi:hypothetical protein
MPGLRQGGVTRVRIVPAGYEFLGPGNEVAYQIPRNYNDVVAKSHDIAYGRLQRDGINPYITFNSADEVFLRDIQPVDVASLFANYIFRGKEFLSQAGLIATGASLFIFHGSLQRSHGR